jgi:flavin reductase (DIM6/NTAB) family NADH-FMN oxidoreductase RutF
MMQMSASERPTSGHPPIGSSLADFAPVQASEFRLAMRHLASGVAIVATGAGQLRRGLTVSSVTSVCTDPPCLLVGINTTSETHDQIIANGCFGVSLLREGQESLARRFAGADGIAGADRFESAPWDRGLTGAPVLATAICAIECVLHQHQVVGSHGLFIGRIVATRSRSGAPIVNFQGELHNVSALGGVSRTP